MKRLPLVQPTAYSIYMALRKVTGRCPTRPRTRRHAVNVGRGRLRRLLDLRQPRAEHGAAIVLAHLQGQGLEVVERASPLDVGACVVCNGPSGLAWTY